MPVTTLDPTTALIVVDLQAGTLRNPMAHPVEGVVANAAALATAFRAKALPVVLATIDGTSGGRSDYATGGDVAWPADLATLAPELNQQPTDLTVTRRTWSVFAGTGLGATLAELGVTQVVIVGLATSFGVESYARAAFDLGFSVTLPVNAMTDPRAEAHDNSVARIFPIIGTTGTAADVLALLD